MLTGLPPLVSSQTRLLILGSFPGVYLITPFQNYDTTVELAQFARER